MTIIKLKSPKRQFDNQPKVDLDSVTVPFGKFKDEPITNISNEYLNWLLENVELSKWGSKFEKGIMELANRRGI